MDELQADAIEAEKERQKKIIDELNLHLGVNLGGGLEYTPQGQPAPNTLID